MDIFNEFLNMEDSKVIKTIDMHTTGEPTRIIISGFPDLKGTLLEQREEAEQKYDDIRKRIMLEPRGHFDMYGAILRKKTELVESGDADIGVLFTHNGGFSTICGHATIALGGFLENTHDENIFPNRTQLPFHEEGMTTTVRIHAPCGLVIVTVPTNKHGNKSDETRSVSFFSAPSFVGAIDMQIEIPDYICWKELGFRKTIKIDIAYGGAFYALVTAGELGFHNGLSNINLTDVTSYIGKLKPFLVENPEVIEAIRHPKDSRLSFLYSVMIVDNEIGFIPDHATSTETGLCYFANNELDRSPTGSCVSARVALAFSKGNLSLNEKRAYNSVVSNHFKTGAFLGSVVKVNNDSTVITCVEGQAYYIGSSAFVWEEGDNTSKEGFIFQSCL